MAKTLIIYPSGDGTIQHTKSSNGSGYTLINETTNNTTGYISQNYTTTVNTLTSNFTTLLQASNVSLGKLRINSINSVNYYLAITKGSSATLSRIDISGSVTINENTYTSESYKPTGSVDRSARTLQIPNANINRIYSSLRDANIGLSVITTGRYTTDSNKNYESYLRIYNANVTISYDDVFDCKAEIISGVGIASATTSLQEVADGETCTFTAQAETDWRFVGWYENSDFSDNPVSTNATYTATITKNTTLYPKAEPKYNINVYGDTSKFSYTCSASGNKEFTGELVTITITPSKSIYKFSGIYEADINGNKLSTHISNDNPYTFTMPANNVYLYVEIGKEIKIYIYCRNCSLSSGSSPIISSSGKTETIQLTYDSTTADWSGIYSDQQYTNRLTQETNYTFIVPQNDVYLYAKAIAKQQIYIKENGVWVGYSAVYVKENGNWVLKDDLEGIFDTLKNYRHITL